MLKSYKILEVTSFAICFILSFYFIIASFNGEFGVSARYRLLAEEKVLRKDLNLLHKEAMSIRNKIRRLSDTSLDLELLDQQARKILGMIAQDELVVSQINY